MQGMAVPQRDTIIRRARIHLEQKTQNTFEYKNHNFADLHVVRGFKSPMASVTFDSDFFSK